MANRVYSVQEIELIGWEKPIKIHPLTIKNLRKLYEKIDFNRDEVKEKAIIDAFVDAAAVAMETFEPKLSDPDVLVEYIDQNTLEYVLEIAAGIKLKDENLETALRVASQDGKI